MPGTPATSPRHGAPRFASTDPDQVATDLNAVVDRFDITAARFDSGLASARPTASIAGRWYYATDTKVLTRDTGSAWEDLIPAAHASRHQDGGADPLTVREAMMATGALGLGKGSFSAYRNAALSLATGSAVVFDTEEYDTSNWYDPTTGRFTPQLAGIYRFDWTVRSLNVQTADVWWLAVLRKNADSAQQRPGQICFQRGTLPLNTGGTATWTFNGTTDFVDVFLQHSAGSAQSISTGAVQTIFQGNLVGRS